MFLCILWLVYVYNGMNFSGTKKNNRRELQEILGEIERNLEQYNLGKN